ncbi:bifunctional diaminohydroxyphosphoribosylaminopyrimidine deaminase/5-amino-6-(5-phosphoribosylamino)uracil reductase RibD [Streptomyces sp. NPDC021212]|uniref:bifunctional diaminohydroxyphosphoribosylaminopyrimidine deaminase/5-amino-6-(5-phosphoribosylamino)uracil reductase RibD n=1 Tax=Streptomyces sp. NPDC021212 TaxID=3365118 RepID=UPI0037AA8B4C
MDRAVALARSHLGRTSPNPVVGCVLLDARGTILGEGVHRGAGNPHAEVEALRAAGARARGATAVVTLEPCTHTGRTGPCTGALLAAGVARVLYAVPDPTPRAGGGAALLRAAGVQVVGDVRREAAEHANELWLTSVRRERPCVTWKFGGTLDGRSGAADGTSRWITGSEARADAHRLRAEHDAVLVGAGTLRADDPHLGLRHGVLGKPPLRIVLSRDGVLRPDARVLDAAAPTLVVTAENAVAARLPHGHETVALPYDTEGLDLTALSRELYRRGLRSVLLEGGAALAAGFARRGMLDRAVCYLAPLFLGANGRPVLDEFGADRLADGLRFEFGEIDRLGEDLRCVLRTRTAAELRPEPRPDSG